MHSANHVNRLNKRMLVPVVVFLIICAMVSGSCSDLSLEDLNRPSAVSTTTGLLVPLDSPSAPARGYFMGILPTPGEGQSFSDSYKEASTIADFVPIWGKSTLFYNLADELSGSWGKTYLNQYVRQNGMFPIVNLSFFNEDMNLITPPGMSGATLADPNWRQAYKQAVLDVVRVARPLYLSIGKDVNRWYEYYGAFTDEPNDFENFVTLYHEIYLAVKQISPSTQVFCTFAREIVANGTEAKLQVLDIFTLETMDILVFSSYPSNVNGINKPSDIPPDYYSKISTYMPGKPFGFSELGWSASDEFGGENGQADFLMRAAAKLTVEQGLNLIFLGWARLNSIDESDTVSLVKRNGDNRLAHVAWLSLFNKK